MVNENKRDFGMYLRLSIAGLIAVGSMAFAGYQQRNKVLDLNSVRGLVELSSKTMYVPLVKDSVKYIAFPGFLGVPCPNVLMNYNQQNRGN